MDSSNRISALNSRQQKALACLMSEATVSAAAAKAGVGLTTLRRWMVLPEFMQAYQQARADSYRETLRLLRRTATAAITTLAKIMSDPDSPKSVRVRAAEVLLEHDRKGVVEEDLLVRIQGLEEKLQHVN